MTDLIQKNRGHVIMFLVYVVTLIGVVYVVRRPEPRVLVITTPTPRPSPTIALIQVQLSGAVNQPGIYSLPFGSRLSDVLEQAGGASTDADLLSLNLARKLKDGEAIAVPWRTPTAVRLSPTTPIVTATGTANQTGTPQVAPTASPGLVNINTAGLDELDRLPHIGPALAQRIIDYRLQNGPYQSIEEIMLVRGIGESTFADIKDLITVGSQ